MRVAALLLLLLQAKPLAAAAICLHASTPQTDCEMPVHESGSLPDRLPGPDHQDSGQSPGPGQGCLVDRMCSTGAPAIEAGPVEVPSSDFYADAHVWFVPEGHSADPTAPPAPPPNA